MLYDQDLLSIQEVRQMIKKAKVAAKKMSQFSQMQIDTIVEQMVKAAVAHAEELAKLAVEETGFGVYKDKVTKNYFASKILHDYIKDMKTVGVIHEDKEKKLLEIAVPVGVVAGLIPSTNPTSTAIYKCIIAMKSANSIILSPHPSARGVISKTCEILTRAAKEAGAPDDVFQCMSMPTLQGTRELMKNVDLILATGGKDMVKAAYSSGVPALGVGPGNVPAFIEKSADIKKAVERILVSKTFDNGVICASEQAVVTEDCIKDTVRTELIAQGAYFLDEEEAQKVGKVIMKTGGKLNAAIVGKSANAIAKIAGLSLSQEVRVLIYEEKGVGINYPFSIEKLSPVLAFYVEKDWVSACERCIEILEFGGIGHSLVIHSQDESIIREFALKKPASRILVNTPSTHGAIGATTHLAPALTLGCGAIGGSATSDNVTPLHLINIKHTAYGVKEAYEVEGIPKKSEEIDLEALTEKVMEILKNLK
ncbi:acetaldehyde dehydrogenase (acetylating) [Cellulosilyticum sp. I15G10I2]|uniref:acetaldehyde dehydrogenase (acetylating) n=1 Tax=Cellulosilyticum sp. I15G10I2 TaxID=1892843 RepID=UPI00085BBFD0|nr:acetaldehyde dehydrogenase (acetylating) [Cellulosilyticum sp. I15G10I2]